jgi:P-type conjugative transfer protein TrbJ
LASRVHPRNDQIVVKLEEKIVNKARRISLAFLIGMVMMTISAPSRAQWVVIDPANLQQNVISAYKLVAGEINQIRDYLLQYQSLEAQLKQLQALGSKEAAMQLLNIAETIAATEEFKKASEELYGNLGKESEFLGEVRKMVSISKLSPQEWMKQEIELFKMKDKQAEMMFGKGIKAIQAVEKSIEKRRQLQAMNASSSGVQSTMQITNQALDVLTGLNSEMLQLIAGEQQVKSAERSEQNARERDNTDYYQKRIRAKNSEAEEFLRKTK